MKRNPTMAVAGILSGAPSLQVAAACVVFLSKAVKKLASTRSSWFERSVDSSNRVNVLSRCTQFPESRLFVFNPFPGFDCIVTALKSRTVAHKTRTN
jgi:hypothetical protein